MSERPARTPPNPETPSHNVRVDDPYAYLGLEMEDLADTFNLIHSSGTNSFGFVLTEPETHDWVMDKLQDSLAQTEPHVISSDNKEETLGAIIQLIQKGRQAKQRAGTTILDLSSVDYDDPDVEVSLSGLNMARNQLISSALLTVLVVPVAKFEIFQQLPDLFSSREFVARFPAAK